jgi:hypothetical protein
MHCATAAEKPAQRQTPKLTHDISLRRYTQIYYGYRVRFPVWTDWNLVLTAKGAYKRAVRRALFLLMVGSLLAGLAGLAVQRSSSASAVKTKLEGLWFLAAGRLGPAFSRASNNART